MFKVLLHSSLKPGLEPGQKKLCGYLSTTGKIELDFTNRLPSADGLAQFDALVLGAEFEVTPEIATDIISFVRGGGGIVCLGKSADSLAENELLRATFGIAAGQRTPVTELIVRVPASSNHPITRRLQAGDAHDHYAGLDRDTAFTLNDSFYLSNQSFSLDESEKVLLVSWRGERLPVAWVRNQGDGKLFYTSLGVADSSWANPIFQQLVFRAISHVVGQVEGAALRVGMLGYGAIGFEHGTAATQVPGLEFAAVCDRNPARLEEASKAFPGIKTYGDARQVREDSDIDLVIVSTPPNLHAPMAIQMLEAGKHVVVEKPFCLTTREADAMVEMSHKMNRTLTVYQCRRWDPDFLAIKSALNTGLIGELFHIETFIGNFSHPCDYWHSHEPVSGGVFYDWGSHYLDWILGLMPGQVESVSGFSHKRVWHDVTNEDQAKLLLRFEGGREAEFIHSDIAAALKPKWYLLGTKGAIVGHWREEVVQSRRWSGDLIEERLAPSESLPILTAHIRQEDGTIHEQKLTLPPAPVFPFHRNLASHILNCEPLAVRPEEARRNIAIMEAAKHSAANGGQFVALEGMKVSI